MLTLLVTFLGIVIAALLAIGLLRAILEQSGELPFGGAFLITLLLLASI